MGKNILCLGLILAMLLTAYSVLALEIENPIAARSFDQLITSLANAVQFIALVFAPVALVFVGFKFITAASAGNEKGLGEAKTMFWWVIIGTAIAVGSSVLAKIIVDTVRNLQ